MKLLRYGPAGSEKPGLLDADGKIRDLSGTIGDVAGAALSDESLAKLAKLAKLDTKSLPLVDGNPRLGPCVGNVGKFICIGLNFADHAAESNLPVPTEPVVFLKATSAICGPYDDVLKPRGATKLDWEVEFGVVIGKKASYVSEADALDHVAGYCVINDVSERNFQTERPGGQWDKGKGCDTFGPLGPWLVTKDEAGDINNLKMWLEVNGKRFQDGSTKTMVFRPAYLISYLSNFFTLHPGDVISTGTPPGVGLGQKPPLYLNAGDVMHLGIENLGEQKQKVIPA
jgi:2-keto-4-pentenoate hydratase/2-oxohepta-3-ene-1,7-dioic acid hydratase in catechol pathway